MIPNPILHIARQASQATPLESRSIHKTLLIILTSPLWAPFALIGVGIILALLLSVVLLIAMAFLGGLYLSWWLPEHWVPQIGEWVYVGPALFIAAAIWAMFTVTVLLGKHLESRTPRFQVSGMRNSNNG